MSPKSRRTVEVIILFVGMLLSAYAAYHRGERVGREIAKVIQPAKGHDGCDFAVLGEAAEDREDDSGGLPDSKSIELSTSAYIAEEPDDDDPEKPKKEHVGTWGSEVAIPRVGLNGATSEPKA